MESILHYTNLKKLEEGTHADLGPFVLYDAFDPNLSKKVSIKLFTAESQETLNHCFEAGRIQETFRTNDHILTVLLAIPLEGKACLVFEGAETSLAEKLRKGPVQEVEAWRILRDMLDALETVHKGGYLHRDVRPENIFYVNGDWKLSDFSVACKQGQQGPTLSAVEYAAPEISSSGKPATDLYALGFTLYHALLGDSKFREVFHDIVSTPNNLRRDGWKSWHQNQDKFAPSPEEQGIDISSSLWSVIEGMIDKSEKTRFESCQAVISEIDKLTLPPEKNVILDPIREEPPDADDIPRKEESLEKKQKNGEGIHEAKDGDGTAPTQIHVPPTTRDDVNPPGINGGENTSRKNEKPKDDAKQALGGKKKEMTTNRNSLVNLILMIWIVVVVAGGGYWWMTKKPPEKPGGDGNQSVEPSPSPTISLATGGALVFGVLQNDIGERLGDVEVRLFSESEKTDPEITDSDGSFEFSVNPGMYRGLEYLNEDEEWKSIRKRFKVDPGEDMELGEIKVTEYYAIPPTPAPTETPVPPSPSPTSEFSATPTSSPTPPPKTKILSLMDEADQAFLSGKISKAESLYGQGFSDLALELDYKFLPDEERANWWIGDRFHKQVAEKMVSAATDIASQLATWASRRIACPFYAGQKPVSRDIYKAAGENLDKVLSFANENCEALTWRGYVDYQLDRLAEAEQRLTKAANCVPPVPYARVFLVRTLALRGEMQRAYDELSQIKESEVPSSWYYNAEAFLKSQDGDYRGALTAYRRAFTWERQNLDTVNIQTIAGLLECHSNSEEWAEAENLLAGLPPEITNSAAGAYLKGIYHRFREIREKGYLGTQQYDLGPAIQALNSAVERDNKFVPAWVHLAHCYRMRKDFQNAADAIAKAREIAPDDPDVMLAYANIFQDQGKQEEAQRTLKELVEQGSRMPEAYFDLAMSLLSCYESGSCSEETLGSAHSYLNKAIEQKPRWSDAYLQRARINMSLMQFDQAVADLGRVLEKVPDNWDEDMVNRVAALRDRAVALMKEHGQEKPQKEEQASMIDYWKDLSNEGPKE